MAFMAPIAAFAAANAGTISAVLGVASAGITGLSAIQQGNYQAAVAKNNAKIAEENAVRASEAAQLEQVRSDRSYAALLGEQLAAQGASGLDITGGSAGRSRMLTRRVRGEAARDIRMQGQTAAMGSLQDAANFRAAGTAAKRQGLTTAIGAGLSAGADIVQRGSLLSRSGGRRPWDGGRPNWYGRA